MKITGLAAALAASTTIVAYATPAIAQQADFNIPAGSLQAALDAYGRQSSRPILYKVDEVRGIVSPGYRGLAAPDEALRAILANTGFASRAGASGSVAIVRVGNGPGAAEAAASTEGRASEGGVTQAESNEIVVTGTNIRGTANSTVPLQSITRAEIDRSGYSTVAQLFETYPQNFVGGDEGASQTGLFGSGSLRETNLTGGTGINLRGLGATSTLVLVDGQRLATTAGGTFVDVSQLPLSAIERVDIVSDGSSAIYGSDAVAGVVNFIFRKDFDGAETQARSGFDTRGTSSEQQVSQLVGNRWSSGSALANVQFRHQSSLSAAERSFTAEAAAPNDLIPRANDFSLYVRGRQSLSSSVEISGQSLLNSQKIHRGYTTLFSSSVTDVKSRNLSFSGGATFRPAAAWQLDVSGSYSRERAHDHVDYVFGTPPGFTNGEVQDRTDFRTWSADTRLAGALLSLPGGAVRLATGASYRKENYTAEIPYLDLSSSFKREVKAGYAELYAPIASPENSVALLHELALSGAVRYDHYSDFGGTTNTRFGAVWAPWRQLRLRVARSTSFRAPSARQKLAAAPGFQFILNLPFPSPSGGSEPVFLLTGSELNLAPERSKNFFASADLVPFPDRSLVIGIDYYRIDFRNRIVSPPIDFGALLHPGLYGSIIRPFASDAEAEAFLQDQLALGAIFFPVLPSGSTGIRNAINVRAQNAAKVVQSGFDIRATFKHEFAAGNLNANLNLAHIDKILTSFIGASQSVDIVDTYGNPLATRLRASLGWATDVYQLTGTLNHSGAYRNPSTIPESRIAAWTTADFDLQLRDRASGFVFGLSILNAFDSKPPKAINPIFPGIGFDPANASAIGRFVSVQVRKTW